MKGILFPIIVFCAFFLAGMRVASSQYWTPVTVPYFYTEATPYFLNENVGFVFAAIGKSSSPATTHLIKTTNGGQTWMYIKYFDDIRCIVQQMCFVSLTHGYIAGSLGVFESTDGGITWQRIYQDIAFFNSVYATGSKVFAIAGIPASFNTLFGPLISTEDGGAHWDTILKGRAYSPSRSDHLSPLVFGNKDSLVFAESVDSNGVNMNLNYSTDLGKTWTSNLLDATIRTNNTYTIGLFCFPHCREILRTRLTASADKGPIERSRDYGYSWGTILPNVEIGAWIAGNNCVLYTSNANGSIQNGPLRSSDRGQNWPYIKGPNFTEIDDNDFHNISVVGGGATAYACDRAGSLWKTTTGGDGTLTPSAFATRLKLSHSLSLGKSDTLIAPPCGGSTVHLVCENLSCNFAHLDSLGIVGLSPGEYSLAMTKHSLCDGIPDTVFLSINPLPPGERKFSVFERFINDEYQTIDTTLSITLISQPGVDHVKLSYDVSSGARDTLTIGACQTGSIGLYFANFFCSFTHLQSVSIDSLDPAEYQISFIPHQQSDYSPDTSIITITPLVPETRTFFVHAHFLNGVQETLDTTISFVIKTISPARANIYLKGSLLSALPADTLEIPLYINGVTPQSTVRPNLDTVNLEFRMNTDLITPLAFFPSVKGIIRKSMSYSDGYASIGMKFDPTFSFTDETELGRLKCVIFLSDTMSTDINLTGNTFSAGCLTTLAASDQPFSLSYQCFDSTLSQFLKYGRSYRITSIVPNPAADLVHVEFTNDGTQLRYQLMDVLGIERISGISTDRQIELDIHKLPAGNYYLRLLREGGASATSLIMVRH